MTTNNGAETKTPEVEKIKNLLDQNFEDEAKNMESEEEDTQRSNLNSKYLYVTFVLNILILLLIFIVFDSCKVRFDIATRSLNKRSWSV